MSIKIFRQKFCLTLPKTSVGNTLLLHKLRVPKKFGEEQGEYQDFPSKIFCLTVSKTSVGQSFTVALISGSEKVDGQEGGRAYHVFPSKNVYLTLPKISIGTPLLLD